MKDRTKRRISLLGSAVFVIYLIALVYFLFFAEQYGRTAEADFSRINLRPLYEIRRFIQYAHIIGPQAVFLNLAGNIIGFMPFGLVLPLMHRFFRHFPRTVLITAIFSISVELLQLYTGTGSCDVDDIILNTLGGVIGYAVFALMNVIRRRYYSQ